MSLGQILKGKRESRKLSIEEAASAVRVSKKYIHALEDENFLLIPSQVYAKGFLKAYSEFLGLDTAQLLSELKDFYKSRERKKVELPPVRGEEFKLPKNLNVIIFSALVVLLMLAFIIFHAFSRAGS